MTALAHFAHSVALPETRGPIGVIVEPETSMRTWRHRAP
jgi:hypothetical protein